MTTNYYPSVARTLRHWAVAGVAALMAVAWVAISLVVPSQAQEGQPRLAAGAKVVYANLGAALYQGSSTNTLRMPAGTGRVLKTADVEVPGLRSSVVLDYADGSKAVCFQPNVDGSNGTGTWRLIEDPTHAPAYSNFFPTTVQLQQAKALSNIFSRTAGMYGDAIYQRVAWQIATGVETRGSMSGAQEEQARAEARKLMAEVEAQATRFKTNAALLKSLRLRITPTANGGHLVQLVGSEEAKANLLDASNTSSKLTINGQSGSIEQALGEGIQVNSSCNGGTSHIEATFDANMKMKGLLTYLESNTKGMPIPFDQVKLVLSPHDVQVHGEASVDVPCSTTPPRPEKPSVPVTPNTPAKPEKPTTPTTPDTPSTPPAPVTPPVPPVPPAKPEVATVAHSQSGSKTIQAGKDAVVVDTVKLTKLTKGKSYRLAAKLMDKETGAAVPGTQPIYVDGRDFSADSAQVTRMVKFAVPASSLKANAHFVVFEKLQDNSGTTLAKHENINDANQTVTVTPKPHHPQIGTMATNAQDGSKTVLAGQDAQVRDTVSIRDFAPGSYTLVGKLVDASGNTVSGVTSQPVNFTVAEGETTKTVEMLFNVPAASVTGTKMVAFEKVYPAGHGEVPPYDTPGANTPVAKHENPNDPGQTVKIKQAPKTGFTVKKAAVNAPAGIQVPQTYSFEYFCGDHAPAASDWQSLGAVRVGDAGKHVGDIKVGSTCYVREANAAVKDTKLTTSWTLNGNPVTASGQVITDAKGSAVGVSFQAGETQAEIAATNTYTVEGGKLSLAKRVSDNTEAKLAPKQVQLRYVCATGAGADALVAQGTKTVSAGAPAVQIDKLLPVGTVCAVSEPNASVAGTSLATSWTVDGAAATPASTTWGGQQLTNAVRTAAVKAGSTVAVVATNTYADNKAGFTLTKHVNSSDPRPNAASYQFSYSCTTGSDSPVTGKFSLKNGQVFASSSVPALKQLKKGSTCQIKETTPAAIEGLDYRGVTYDALSDGVATFSTRPGDVPTLVLTLTRADKAAAFSATNTFEPVQHTPQPKIATILAGAKGAKTIDLGKAGETVKLVDTVTYQGLLAGKKYYLQGKLVDGSGNDLGISAVSDAFIPAGKNGSLASGTAELTFTVPAEALKSTSKVVAFEKLWAHGDVTKVTPGTPGKITPKGPDSTPTAKHENPDDPSQTVVVKHPKKPSGNANISLVKRIQARGVQIPVEKKYNFRLTCGATGTPGAIDSSFEIVANTVKKLSVPAGVPCTLSEDSAAAQVNGVAARTGFTLEGANVHQTGQGNTFAFTVPTGTTGHLQLTAENSYIHDAPKPEIGTVATNAADGSKQLPYSQNASIDDVMAWKNLPAGMYVMVPSLMKNINGQVTEVKNVAAGPVPFKVAEGATHGEVKATLTVSADQVIPDSVFVVFERIYRSADVDPATGPKMGAVPVASHADPSDKGQTVTVTHKTVQPAAIVLKKNVVNYTGDHKFNFTVACTQDDGQFGPETLVSLSAGQSSQPVKTVAGATCRVHEDPAAARIEGAAPTVTWAGNQGVQPQKVDESTVKFVVPAQGGQILFEATNSYSPVQPPVPPTPENPHKPTPTPTPSVPTTPPCTYPPTPGQPTTPGVPGRPGKPGKPGKPTTPGVPTVPECPTTPPVATPPVPPVTTPPCTYPPTPGQPTTPGVPGRPGKPGKPTTPGHPTIPECPSTPKSPEPKLATIAVDGSDHDKYLTAGLNGVIVDTVEWTNLPAGSYTLVGTLMDKATGLPVPGSTQLAPAQLVVPAGQTSGALTMAFTVPGVAVSPGSHFVVFERLYKSSDVDPAGHPVRKPNGVEAAPVVSHSNLGDENQTVTVTGDYPPKPYIPGVWWPHRPVKPFVPTSYHRPPQMFTPPLPSFGTTRLTPLAKTGVATGTLAILAGSVLLVGAAIVRLRRQRG